MRNRGLAIGIGAALLFFGFSVAAIYMLANAQTRHSSYVGAVPAPYSIYPQVSDAVMKGPDGWPELQALMLDSDDSLAFDAAYALASAGNTKAFELFFEQLPKVTATVKHSVRHAYYDGSVVQVASTEVRDRDPKTAEGAMLFLKLAYMRDSYAEGQAAFKTLVAAIPDYDGAKADELAYTISLFNPGSLQPLYDMLDHEEPRARLTAVTALGKMGREESEPFVAKLAADPNSDVRAAATRSVANIKAAVSARAKAAAAAVTYGNDPRQPDQKAKNRLGMP